MGSSTPKRPRSLLRNVTIENCGGGMTGSVAHTDFESIKISGTKVPIDFDEVQDCTFSDVDIEAIHQPSQQRAETSDRQRKYFGGFSFKKGDHLKK